MVAVALIKNMFPIFGASPDFPMFVTLSAVLCVDALWAASMIETILDGRR